MKQSTIYLKGYFKLLIKYIRYDLKILFYISSIFVAVFFYISFLLQSEADRILEEYGGLDEIKMTTVIKSSYKGIPQRDLQILLEIFNKYEIEDIKEICLNFQPLTTVGVQSTKDAPTFDGKIDGRYFTIGELTDGNEVVILSLEDYKCFFLIIVLGTSYHLAVRIFN